MTTFALIHGAGDCGWVWYLLEEELRCIGHATVAPDFPSEYDSCGFAEYPEAVVEAVDGSGTSGDVVVVGHSLGGCTAPLAAELLGATQLVMLAATVPKPGESPDAWWSNTGYPRAVARQAARDGGVTGNADPMVLFYNGVPEGLARKAERRAQAQSQERMREPWPMDEWPDVPTRFILCRDDHFFPPDFFRELVPYRLGMEPEEIDGGHYPMLSGPAELAGVLVNGALPGNAGRQSRRLGASTALRLCFIWRSRDEAGPSSSAAPAEPGAVAPRRLPSTTTTQWPCGPRCLVPVPNLTKERPTGRLKPDLSVQSPA